MPELLIVARWPLGGIRTYMRYVYRNLPAGYKITLIAASTLEDDALQRDVAEFGGRFIQCDGSSLTKVIFRELRTGRYAAIQSHGFTSALYAYAANLCFRIPHVLTVHGILEERLVAGFAGRLRMALTAATIRNVDMLYAVSNDILAHLREKVSNLDRSRCRQVVIPNGIDVKHFDPAAVVPGKIRLELGLDERMLLFGFLGRFMQQKGFNYLIDAVEILRKSGTTNFRILAVGSGDFLQHYQKIIRERQLEDFFCFQPFSSEVSAIYAELDAVVMPSIWEASGLLAMEALCMGVPLVASNCIGLRETVMDTPALVFESQDSKALAQNLGRIIAEPVKPQFTRFAPMARERFDVRRTAQALHDRLAELI